MDISKQLIDEVLIDSPYKCIRISEDQDVNDDEVYDFRITDGVKCAKITIRKDLWDIVPDQKAFLTDEIEPYIEAMKLLIH